MIDSKKISNIQDAIFDFLSEEEIFKKDIVMVLGAVRNATGLMRGLQPDSPKLNVLLFIRSYLSDIEAESDYENESEKKYREALTLVERLLEYTFYKE